VRAIAERNQYNNVDIIVIDNGSTDDSENIIDLPHQDITIVQTGSNLGFVEAITSINIAINEILNIFY